MYKKLNINRDGTKKHFMKCGRADSSAFQMKEGSPGFFASPAKKADPRRTIGRGKNFNPVSKDKSATGGAAGGGMSQVIPM